jgi:hypothetical protein
MAKVVTYCLTCRCLIMDDDNLDDDELHSLDKASHSISYRLVDEGGQVIK